VGSKCRKRKPRHRSANGAFRSARGREGSKEEPLTLWAGEERAQRRSKSSEMLQRRTMRRRPKSQDCASVGDRPPLPAGRRSKSVVGLILKPRGCGPPLARSQRILTGVCNCFYYFFIVVIRYETKTAARRALTFIVRIFVNDTIAITVWTSFYFHACSCSHWTD
jgi:hypothetical protein